jgi:hypothetical protein
MVLLSFRHSYPGFLRVDEYETLATPHLKLNLIVPYLIFYFNQISDVNHRLFCLLVLRLDF